MLICLHGFFMADDRATQQACFINLPTWREFLKERYQRLFDAVNEAGMHAWRHSCGYINGIVGEWIDCGSDVVNPEQPRALGIEEI